MSPEIMAFLKAMFAWAMAGTGPSDYAETLRGPRDSGILPFAAVAEPIQADASLVIPENATPGVTVGAYLPQALEDGQEPVPIIRYAFNEWPLTFATHNARITAERGSDATLNQWVAYAGTGILAVPEPGAYSLEISFRAPAAASCYAAVTVNGIEVFPTTERRIRKELPPRIVMEAGERRTFIRQMQLGGAGNYKAEFALACHPGRKPSSRLAANEFAAWAESSISLAISGKAQQIDWIQRNAP